MISLNLVIILFHDITWPHVARMTLQKLTDLGYETFATSTNKQFFKYQDPFFYIPKKHLIPKK